MNYDALLAQINKIAGALQPLYSFIEFSTLLQSSTDIVSVICQDYYGDYLGKDHPCPWIFFLIVCCIGPQVALNHTVPWVGQPLFVVKIFPPSEIKLGCCYCVVYKEL